MRVYNFGAGPAMLPDVVMQQAQEELLDWNGTGMSVAEISHRSREFQDMLAEAEQDCRQVLSVPNNYHVLFLTEAARAQFSMIPLNLCRDNALTNYIVTGIWSKMAADEGVRFSDAKVIADCKDSNYTTIPDSINVDANAAFVHYTPNETINGVEFHDIPDTGDVPLVADMTSTLFSRPLDVSRFGVIYAGAQKNLGPAGLTLVIVRDDLVGHAMANTPKLYDYATHRDNDSLYNTPATFSYYVAGLTLKWLQHQGGLAAMAEVNQRKSQKLYQYIDESDFYRNPIPTHCRSWMNVPFILADDSRNAAFLEQSKAAGLAALKGHRLVGGMRASIYNAMPEAGVDALIDFMKHFATHDT